MRRLLILASAVVFLDVAFFEAITPLLAGYKDDLGLSTAGAGILVGAYAAGTFLTALPAGYLAARIGPRKTVMIGVTIFGFSTAAFGLVTDIVWLDIARFAQGVAGALLWSGGLTWLITSADEDRRGEVIGIFLGAAVAGALFGPAIGALAHAVGIDVVFPSVLALSLVLLGMAFNLPDSTVRERGTFAEITKAMSARPVIGTALLVGLPSMMFGVITVLVPLEIADLGGGPGLVAVGFGAAAGIEAVLAPMVGKFSDRRGRLLPYVVGVFVSAVAMLLVPVSVIPVVLGALVFSALGAGLCFAPATTMLADAAEATGLHQGLATGVSSVAWSAGQATGAVGGGALADAAGVAAPCIAVSLILVGAGVVVYRQMAAGQVTFSEPGSTG